jgi:hypothetical protein
MLYITVVTPSTKQRNYSTWSTFVSFKVTSMQDDPVLLIAFVVECLLDDPFVFSTGNGMNLMMMRHSVQQSSLRTTNQHDNHQQPLNRHHQNHTS